MRARLLLFVSIALLGAMIGGCVSPKKTLVPVDSPLKQYSPPDEVADEVAEEDSDSE